MLEKIRELLSANGTGPDGDVPTPEVVREAIDGTEAKLERARERLDEMNERHGRVLLHGSDDALDAHERKIELTEREIARLETVREELDVKLEEAKEAQETREDIAEADEAMEFYREGEELVEEYVEHSHRMVEICERLEEVDREFEKRAEALSRSPEHEARKAPGAELQDNSGRKAYELAEIPPTGPGAPMWNARPWREGPSRLKRPNKDGKPSSSQRPAGVYDGETGERIDGPSGTPRRGTVSEGI